MLARLDRYAAAVDRCVARHPPPTAREAARMALKVEQGLCESMNFPGCPDTRVRTVRGGCVTLLKRGLLTPRWD